MPLTRRLSESAARARRHARAVRLLECVLAERVSSGHVRRELHVDATRLEEVRAGRVVPRFWQQVIVAALAEAGCAGLRRDAANLRSQLKAVLEVRARTAVDHREPVSLLPLSIRQPSIPGAKP